MRKIIFLSLSVLFCLNADSQSVEFYRHLTMNHMTPRMELTGLHRISEVAAAEVAHYKFSYDEEMRLSEIINSHPSVRGQHPLSDIGAYRVLIEYPDNRETRTYFDASGNQIQNMRQVSKEISEFDAAGFKKGLTYYDEQDRPIESSWGVAEYKWSKYGDKVLEKRYDLDGNPQILAPFFSLGSTLIEYGENGLITGQYNVDENYNIVEHPTGMASYHDIHDQYGSVVLILYRDSEGKLVNAADGNFAAIQMVRDQFGNLTESRGITENGVETWYYINQYDLKGNFIRKIDE